MTRRSDWAIGVVSALGLLILLGWQSERDQRIAAEDAARQIATAAEDAARQIAIAADVPCPPREGYHVVASVAMDGHEWARMCGYYRTVIESVRVTWERAR